MRRTFSLVGIVVTLAALSATASAADPTVQVHGGGQALVIAPDDAFPASFAINGVLNSKGSAHGSVNFVFGPEFSAVWGAAPGVHTIHVWGQVTSITVGDDGTIHLAGTATEVDVLPGEGKLVSENEPFEVVITGPGQFTFQWCELPVFEFDVTTGNLVVR
jgi:hypothetical protein